jgi:tetratricopeptide (TPR) repeat protein
MKHVRFPLFLAAAALLAVVGCTNAEDTARFKRVKEKLESDKDNDRAIGAEMAVGIKHPRNVKKLIPILIERLDPKKEKNPWASMYAAGALSKLTGQDFGSQQRNYQRWHSWWYKEAKQKVPKREEQGKRHLERLRAKRMNEDGEFHLAGGNVVKAMDLFRQAIVLDGTQALYHSNLGLALLKMGDPMTAEQRFDDAIAVDKKFLRAYLNKGTVYADHSEKLRAVAGRIESAIKAYATADNHKLEKKAREDLAKALKEIRAAEDKALDTYRHALASDTGNQLWAAWAAMGRIYMQRGDFEKAVNPLEKARDLRKNDIGIHRDLALTYYGLDQYYRASKEIRRVEELGGKMDPGFTKKVEQKVQEMMKNLPG